MSERGEYPAGAPCWVENLSPNPVPEFYAGLFGWEIDDEGVARLDGRAVAGIRQGPLPVWATYVRVKSVAETAERAGGTLPGMPALQDPTGAVIALHESACAETVNEAGAWVMSSLHTSDNEAAAAWYGEVFGWEPTPFGPLTLFTLPGYHGGEDDQPIPRDTVAVMAAPDPNVPTHWSVAFGASDVDAAAERTAELGGSVLMGPMDTPGFRSAVLLDPNGAAFTILEPRA